MKKLLITAAVSVCVATSSFAGTITDTFSSFFVLGDSLSDNGNLFNTIGIPGAPFVDGRFSDGPVWNEGLANEFIAAGKLSANFAFGGATATGGIFPPPVDVQALSFAVIDPAALGPRSLVSIWAGANDIRGALQSGNPFSAPAAGIAAANSIASTISALTAFGINDFLVFNLPDLGLTADLLGTPGAPLGTASASAFNGQLTSNLAALKSSVNIIEVDIFTLFNDIVANPMAFDFENVEQACILNLGTCDPSSWLFFDGIHPTTFAHGQIETFARSAILSTIPLPAGAPLYFLALMGFGLVARRRN